MQLISVNIGEKRAIKAKSGSTGIYKLPASGPVEIGVLGIATDVIVDVEHHGGLDQAIYIYGTPDYEWWSKELGQNLVPGTFGENLTISELESARSLIGDRLKIGTVTLEVTYPRIPCVTLAARMGDPEFVKRYRHAERPGIYCRVLQPGVLQAGDAVEYIPYPDETISALEMFRDFYAGPKDAAKLRRYLAAPLTASARQEYEEQLRKLLERFGD